jgi:hypothetical protein
LGTHINPDTLETWTTEAIYYELRTLGIDTDRTRFADQVKNAGDPSTLRAVWKSGEKWLTLWDEVLLSAAAELQRRLTADRPALESAVDKLVDAIDELPAHRDQPPGVGLLAIIPAAMPLTAYLESFPSAERGEKYQTALGIAERDLTIHIREALRYCGAKFPDDTIRIAEALSQAMPDAACNFLPLVPAALYNAGRWHEAFDRLGPCLERFPFHTPTILGVGRLYDALGQQDLALDAFRRGLARAPNAAEWRVFRDRTVELLEKMGREGVWTYYESLAPCPVETASNIRTHTSQYPSSPTPFAPATVVSVPFRASQKIGANDLCPCGSGKKYKRCCRRELT